MRCSLAPRPLAVIPCVLLAVSCVQPEYPDEFEETTQPSLTPDTGLPVSSGEAGPWPLFDAGVPPAAMASPEAGIAASMDAGAQPGAGFDAGPVAPPPRDADMRPQADASATSDARANDDAGGPPGDMPTRCMIAASTDASNAFPYAGKYGCAVWIGDASKKVIKAFFVGTRIATRSGLSAYRTASAGVTVDVVAGATLNAPKQHTYTWDLKTAGGAAAAPGSYTLNVETHSSNGDKTVSVPFMLGAGMVTAMATPAGDVRAASIRCE